MKIGDKFKHERSNDTFEVLDFDGNRVKVGYDGNNTGWTRKSWLRDECIKVYSVPQDDYSKQKRKLKL